MRSKEFIKDKMKEFLHGFGDSPSGVYSWLLSCGFRHSFSNFYRVWQRGTPSLAFLFDLCIALDVDVAKLVRMWWKEYKEGGRK